MSAAGAGNVGQHADDTVIVRVPASLKYLHLLRGCIADVLQHADSLPNPAQTIHDMQLAVQELCVNIIEHAYADQPGQSVMATLTLDAAAGLFVVQLHDTGRPFTPAQVPPPDLQTVHERGYGLFLAHSLLDEVVYTPQTGEAGNCWRLVKRLVPPPEAPTHDRNEAENP